MGRKQDIVPVKRKDTLEFISSHNTGFQSVFPFLKGVVSFVLLSNISIFGTQEHVDYLLQ